MKVSFSQGDKNLGKDVVLIRFHICNKTIMASKGSISAG